MQVVHKGLTQARLKHDNKDLQTLLKCIEEGQLFSKDTNELCSLPTKDLSANVDSTKDVGVKKLSSTEGISVAKYKFSKKTR